MDWAVAMKNKHTSPRTATAAIAAALALLATPATAQNTAVGGTSAPIAAPIVPPPVLPQESAAPAPVKPKATVPVRTAPSVSAAAYFDGADGDARCRPARSRPELRPSVARLRRASRSQRGRRQPRRVAQRRLPLPPSPISLRPNRRSTCGNPLASRGCRRSPASRSRPVSLETQPAGFQIDDEEVALAALAGLLGLGAAGGLLYARRRRQPEADGPIAAQATERVIEPEPAEVCTDARAFAGPDLRPSASARRYRSARRGSRRQPPVR